MNMFAIKDGIYMSEQKQMVSKCEAVVQHIGLYSEFVLLCLYYHYNICER